MSKEWSRIDLAAGQSNSMPMQWSYDIPANLWNSHIDGSYGAHSREEGSDVKGPFPFPQAFDIGKGLEISLSNLISLSLSLSLSSSQ